MRGLWHRRGGSSKGAPPQHDVISSNRPLSSNGAFNAAFSKIVWVFTLGAGIAKSVSCGGSSSVTPALVKMTPNSAGNPAVAGGMAVGKLLGL